MDGFIAVLIAVKLKIFIKGVVDKTSSYEEVMEKDGLVSIHYKNIQKFAVEMFKVKNVISPAFFSDIFLHRRVNHNFR